MTSKERILAAVRHQEGDFVPVSPRIWAFLLGYYGSASPIFHLKAAEEFGYDSIINMGTGPSDYFMHPISGTPPFMDLEDIKVELTIERKGDLSEFRRVIRTPAGALRSAYIIGKPGNTYGISPNYHHLEHLVKDRNDFEKLEYILPAAETCNFSEYFRTEEMYGDRGVVFARPAAGVDHFLADAFGMENLSMLYLDDRDFFMQAVQFFHEYYQSLLRHTLEQGVRYIFESWYNFSLSAGWSPQMYREVVIPCLKSNVDLVHSFDGIMLFYDDGKMMQILPDLVQTGVDIIETLSPPPVGDVDLARAKEIARGKSCLKGNIDIVNVIRLGTAKLVEEKVEAAIACCKSGGGFILATSDSIRDGSPLENVKRFFEAGRKYGKF
ncbi:hypothetical protein JXJ21_13035 [candidate division KSB1 bacterium]|nr:hypothetical protein [candidate division KSB1 bacterium]